MPGVVEPGDVPLLHHLATLLIYPSLMEGFGLPPAEAMAMGTPVLVSNASSLPEVGGEAALYCSPDAVGPAAALLAGLLCDETKRQAAIDRGRLHVRKFSWELHFARLQKIYRELLAMTPQP